MKDALQCLIDAAQQAGGSVRLISAFRTQEYQLHIREVWDKYYKLQEVEDNHACDAIRHVVNPEFAAHGPWKHRPAGSAGYHTLGVAIEVSFSGPINSLALAHGCGLCRPLPVDDTTHYELCSGGRCSCTP